MVYTVEQIVLLMEDSSCCWNKLLGIIMDVDSHFAASWLVQDNSCCWSRLFGVSMDVVLCSKLIV